MIKAWKFVLYLVLTLAPKLAIASVWSHSQEWTEAWETKYSQWVQQNLTTQFLKQTGMPFSNWHVDCAKFVYLQRLYFSYLNGLEFAVVGAGVGQKISSQGTQWDGFKNSERRLQSFAQYVLNHVDTSTLQRDTVLIPVKRESIRPGIILAADSQRAHTWLIREIRPSGAPVLIYATLPASEFLYESYVFPASETAFPLRKVPSAESGGLRRFRWPQDLFKRSSEILYSSSEQSQIGYQNFFSVIQERLRKAAHSPNEDFGNRLEDLCMKLRVRVNIIIDAAHALERSHGNRLSADQFELYSTYARDRDILVAIQKLDEYFHENRFSIGQELGKSYASLLHPRWNTEDFCWVAWAENRSEPAGYLREKILAGRISSDPYSSFSQRWGE